ncbi:hypothetical protein JY651_13705 [Pyxidicoccus parkwayensis]|uniref:Ketosynthase family 3 (KS3) domain-containing protein n=1 Tax=Pyxidicoccus parkwayensis TaxID=2813578 RepID=A0ABX7P602_9BACT|nr:beta-ketoacyl synthase N-terminal-like domain-containing protein [Pyxidicoccus parkwaysis]QSQ25915.1 hypothetical protein JY651_13705 [Pyxidicoccus parkwaysis]
MRHLYVVGRGACSILGADHAETVERLFSGAALARSFQESGIGLEVPALAGVISGLDRRLGGRFREEGAAFRLVDAASREALRGAHDCRRLRIYGGSNHGETDVLLALSQMEQGAAQEEPRLWEALLRDPLPERLPSSLGPETRLEAWTYSACASAMHALAFALLDAQEDGDEASLVLVVGGDALSGIGMAGFYRLGASTRGQCRPFHADRDGLLVSEGAAALLLSTTAAPGTPGPVRLLGMGMSCDAFHPTQPDPEGAVLERAMRAALEQAGVRLTDVGGLILHGTGTLANDAAEASVCARLWPAASIPVTSLKGALGHTMGASGLFNCVVAVEALQRGRLPPTRVEGASAFEGVDLVTGAPRPLRPGAPLLVSASGFGGNNVCAVFGVGR